MPPVSEQRHLLWSPGHSVVSKIPLKLPSPQLHTVSSPPWGAPAGSAGSPAGAPTPRRGRPFTPGPSSPLSRQPAPASRAALSPPPSGPLTSAAPAHAPARRGLRRSAPGCRRLLRLPRTDNEGQACRVTSASRRRGLRRGVGLSLTPRPLRPSFSLAGTWTPPSFYCPPSWVPRACCRHCGKSKWKTRRPAFKRGIL